MKFDSNNGESHDHTHKPETEYSLADIMGELVNFVRQSIVLPHEFIHTHPHFVESSTKGIKFK